MELFFPLLLVFFAFVSGWIAGIYLLIQWIRQRKQGNVSAVWVQVWSAGWISSAIGIVILFIETRSPSLASLMSPLHALGALALYAGPVLWIIAWFLFRKDRIPQTATVLPEEPSKEGVWPPPPAM